MTDTWRRICQIAFADDWCGCFESVRDLKKAWNVWRVWEAATGSKLGVKKKLKTVVTGVRYVEGKAVSMEDPLLRLRGGGFVPFAHHDETCGQPTGASARCATSVVTCDTTLDAETATQVRYCVGRCRARGPEILCYMLCYVREVALAPLASLMIAQPETRLVLVETVPMDLLRCSRRSRDYAGLSLSLCMA